MITKVSFRFKAVKIVVNKHFSTIVFVAKCRLIRTVKTKQRLKNEKNRNTNSEHLLTFGSFFTVITG